MAPRIGNRKDARTIYVAHQTAQIPEGWKNIGSGSYRVAYLHEESGVVYKVDRYDRGRDGFESNVEVRHARALWKESGGTGILGTRFRVPKVSAFKFGDALVVAMEVIKGVLMADAPDASICADGRLELYRIGRFLDMHAYNFFIDEDGYAVPVDMASPRSKHADVRVLSGTVHYAKEWERRRNGW